MANVKNLTVRGMLHRSARYFPDNEAAVDESYRYTYAELLDKVRRAAAIYHGMGVRKGDRVAMMLLPSANHVVALFAAYELGAIPVALHVRESTSLLVKTLERLSPRILVYDPSLSDQVDELRELCPGITGYVGARSGVTTDEEIRGNDVVIPDQLDQYEMDFEPMAIDAQDIALICLSSGTTGIPKGVIHRNGPTVESARGGAYIWGSNPHSCQLVPISTSFTGWSNAVFPLMNVGAKSVFMAHFHPQRYMQTLQDEKCTMCVLIPTIWRMLFQMDISGYDLSNVELAGFAGEVIDGPTLEKIRTQITPNIINIYGTTETLLCGGTIMFSKDMTPERIESVGKPLLNGEIRIIEPGGTVDDELPANEEGEIIVSGPSVSNEMWADPALTRKVFEDGWWHSGDLGRLDEDNYLYINGRIDDMIISGGINVMPAPIEQTILDHPQVTEVAVVGIKDEQWGQRITAFVALKDSSLTAEELHDFVCASPLSHYQRPRDYQFVEELPKGPTGKLSRKALRS